MHLRILGERLRGGVAQAGQAQEGIAEPFAPSAETVKQRFGVVAHRKEEMDGQPRLIDHAHELFVELNDACAFERCDQMLLEAVENDEKAQPEFLVPPCEAACQGLRRGATGALDGQHIHKAGLESCEWRIAPAIENDCDLGAMGYRFMSGAAIGKRYHHPRFLAAGGVAIVGATPQ
ncbi:MAG TPA: hypothetical protein VKF40_01500 [Burkholderiales bacterium]|nr:hypothetical protein [Burkholderiales bacterium]